MEDRMRIQLDRRRENGSIRAPLSMHTLEQQRTGFDFSTNDYLGLAQSARQKKVVEELHHEAEHSSNASLGATGSRLLSGDSLYARNLELWLAKLHQRPTATLFNSGYDANLSIISSVLLQGDLVILDELCHNSLVMGVRMSREQACFTFEHNNVDALERILRAKRHSNRGGKCLIVVESVYSMDGDVAPLKAMLDLAAKYKADVVVDEAHGLGIYGSTNRQDLKLLEGSKSGIPQPSSSSTGGTGVLAALQLEHHPALLCSVHTFGKAAGCHGAIICGSSVLRDFLWNYARPLIYSTAMPLHSLVAIRGSYQSMVGPEGEQRRRNVFSLVRLFREIMTESLAGSPGSVSLWASPSPIQALVIAGNEVCIQFCKSTLERFQIRLYPIRAPTVPIGQERVRIIIHAHNSEREIRYLCQALLQTLVEMRLSVVAPSKL
jgi:8-amino-7-oxononanoate synthase